MTRLGIIGTGGTAASHARSFSACCDVSNGARVQAYLDASFLSVRQKKPVRLRF
jgi:hypothetical protein